MIAIKNFKFKRYLTPPNACGDPSLIVFSDASRQAFGACAYVQWKLKDGRLGLWFAAAKSRVTPLKEVTIPRLQLQAAVIASRLGSNIVEESPFKFERIRYFSDSLVKFSWTRSESTSFKPFVSCWVGEIQSKSKPAHWFHCPTMLNVAEDSTKGILVEEMNGRLFNSPKFLQQGEEFWPVEQGTLDFKEDNKKKRKGQIIRPASVNKPVIDCKKFSTWKRLLKVTAYVIRFCNNLCNKTHQAREGDKVSVDPPDAEKVEKEEVSSWTYKNSQMRLQTVKPICRHQRHHSSWWVCRSSSRVVRFKACCPLAIQPLDINVNYPWCTSVRTPRHCDYNRQDEKKILDCQGKQALQDYQVPLYLLQKDGS